MAPPDDVSAERIEEGQKVKDLIDQMEIKVRPGSIWYLISNSWMQEWQKYVYYDYLRGQPMREVKENQRSRPGPINNSDIIMAIPNK